MQPAKAPPARLLAISVGNTTTVGIAVTQQFVWTAIIIPTRKRFNPSTLRRLLRTSNLLPDAHVLLCGVVPEAVERLELFFRQRHGLKVWRFRKNLPCPLKILPKPKRSVGDDRLAGALGALAIDPSRPWVIIDCGTALTVNSVRPSKGKFKGVFEGGLIMPGERLSLKALHEQTAQLPLLAPWPPKPPMDLPVIGRSTQEAVRAGVRWAQLGAMVAAAKAQAQRLGPRTRVVITGGGLDWVFQAAFKQLKRYHPTLSYELVSDGLLAAWVHKNGPLFKQR